MSETKHTAGKWEVTETRANAFTVRSVGKGAPVAEIWLNGDDARANADLIAAAPELLAECIFIVGQIHNALHEFCNDTSPRNTEDYETIVKSLAWDCLRVERVIAKARGEHEGGAQ